MPGFLAKLLSPLLPSFEDIEKVFSFWLDQQDKYFYFETAPIEVLGYHEIPSVNLKQAVMSSLEREARRKRNTGITEAEVEDWYEATVALELDRMAKEPRRAFFHERLLGKIVDIPFQPPSIELGDVTIKEVELLFAPNQHPIVRTISQRKQANYGLMMTRIHYYERIHPSTPDEFIANNPRWRDSFTIAA